MTQLPIDALLRAADYVVVLRKIFRQKSKEERVFMKRLRYGQVTPEVLAEFGRRARDIADIPACDMTTRVFNTRAAAADAQDAAIAYLNSPEGVRCSMPEVASAVKRFPRTRGTALQPVRVEVVLKQGKRKVEVITHSDEDMHRVRYLTSGYFGPTSQQQELLDSFGVPGALPDAVQREAAKQLQKLLIRGRDRNLCVGLPVTLTTNMSVRQGLANGTCGVVLGFLRSHERVTFKDQFKLAAARLKDAAKTQQEKQSAESKGADDDGDGGQGTDPPPVPVHSDTIRQECVRWLQAMAAQAMAPGGCMVASGIGSPVVAFTLQDGRKITMVVPDIENQSKPIRQMVKRGEESKEHDELRLKPWEEIRVKTFTCPLLGNVGVTINRAQGMEVERLIVFGKGMGPGKMYTACSRVRSLAGLTIARYPFRWDSGGGKLPPAHFGTFVDSVTAHPHAVAFDKVLMRMSRRAERTKGAALVLSKTEVRKEYYEALSDRGEKRKREVWE